MKKISHLAVLALLLCAGLAAHAQSTVHTFTFGGLTRSYRLYVPATYTGATAVPLVFNLHGYTSNAQQQEFYSGMNAVADTAGFLLCFPDGVNNAWNSGFTFPYTGGVNDVGFISVLIDSLRAGYNIDPTRVYSCGMSNGGFMSYRLACDLDERIAAIASVTGSMSPLQTSNCTATRPVPVLEIHGTNDNTVPYGGTTGIIGIDSVLNFWRVRNACNQTTHDTLPNISTTDLSTVTTQWDSSCNAGTEVAHFKVQGGGHTWPGAFYQIPGDVTNQDFKASVEIWRFFSRHVHPNPVLTSLTAANPAWLPKAYPQPSHGLVHISDVQPGDHLTLHAADGRKVWSGSADGHTATVDLTTQPTGMYLLTIEREGARRVLKLLHTL